MLRQAHGRGAVSRAELTDTLGLNRSTVGALVGDLVEAGLVVEGRPEPGEQPGRVGRPSLVVRPAPHAATVLAVHMDVHLLRVARVGLGGQVIGQRRERLPPGSAPEVVTRRAAELALELVSEDPLGSDDGRGTGRCAPPTAVTVAVPGTVRALDGTVAVAPHLGWQDAPLAAEMSRALTDLMSVDLPVQVANDADLGVLAERMRGAARGSDHVIYLCGTYGLGGGIVSGGQRLVGSRGFAGEVGHVSVDAAGRACRCGSRGCWESEAMASAWAGPFELDPSAPDVAAQVLARLAVGDVAARRTRDIVSRSFARGLASVANVFDPDLIVLGDGLWWELWPTIVDDVMPWLQRLVIPVLRERLPVRRAGLGRDSTILGAAELAFTALLADPLRATQAVVQR